jgi:cell division protease FtsH
MILGGRVAEEIVFGPENVTTGAGDDIRKATSMARCMVTEYGFSDKLGPLRYDDNEEEVFLGHSVTQRKNVSDATALLIDQEVRRLIEEGRDLAKKILTEHREDLDTLAHALLEFESLSGEEINALLRGEPIVRPDEEDTPTDNGRRSSVPTTGGKTKDAGRGDATDDLEPEPQPGT